jgi:hypothetical protein
MSKSSYLSNEELLENIARDLKEMHIETGIDLAYWDTALEIVRRFYKVNVHVQIEEELF